MNYKIRVAAVGLLIISSFFCILPKYIVKVGAVRRAYPYITVFTAGLQLATILVDLIPHMVSHDHSDHHKDHNETDHSKATEKPSESKPHNHKKHDHHHHKEHDHHHHHSHNIAPFMLIGFSFLALLAIDVLYLHGDNCSHSGDHNHSHPLNHNHNHGECSSNSITEHNSNSSAKHSHSEIVKQNPHKSTKCCGGHHSNSNTQTSEGHNHEKSHKEHLEATLSKSESIKPNQEPQNESLGTCNTASISKSSSKAQALTCLFAISIHSFFEGLSVTESKIASAFGFGLLMHKILESFSLGVAILASPFSMSSKLSMILVYSILTPLGILVANEVSEHIKNAEVWFNALSLGSMLFIVCIEMISHSFHNNKNSGKKIFIILLGYILGCIFIKLAH